MSWFRWDNQVLQLQLHIQPGARQNLIVGLHGNRLKVKINAPPVDGKANAALIEFLSQCFGTSKAGVTLVQGAQGRSKIVCIAQVTHIPAELQALGLSAYSESGT